MSERDHPAVEYGKKILAISGVVKKRFPNLTVEETLQLATEILYAVETAP